MSPFVIQFSPQALDHLRYFPKRDQQIILSAIEVHLSDQADKQTRKRKKLEENPLAPWELRLGDFRVFYDIDSEKPLWLSARRTTTFCGLQAKRSYYETPAYRRKQKKHC